MEPGKYSFGTGDRFGKEGQAQLRAIQEINRLGFPVVPVWNKSNREHQLTGTTQASVRLEAEEAVRVNKWRGAYFVDADHISLETIDNFLDHSDFFTLDVAGYIGRPPDRKIEEDFLRRTDPGDIPAFVSGAADYDIKRFAGRYLTAIQEVKRLHDYIQGKKPEGFITEISMDEVSDAQSPADLYFILKELSHLGIRPHTIAPKFSGIFAKGVDYEGNTDQFANEFEQDIRILASIRNELDYDHAIRLSIHSGSDKFSIYPVIRRLTEKYQSGFHLKTAGTTWLEEVIGLARGGGDGLRIAKEVYIQGMRRFSELAAPYLSVLHIDEAKLPPAKEVVTWSSAHFAATLIHDQGCRDYNSSFRQLVHISYKIAAEMGREFEDALVYYRDPIEDQVYTNFIDRHLKRLFQD